MTYHAAHTPESQQVRGTRIFIQRLWHIAKWPFSVDYVAATPRELMAQDAWEQARDMLGWGQWVFDNGLRSLDERLYLTAEQAKAAGFKSTRPWIRRWRDGA